MEPRLNLFANPALGKALKHIVAAAKAVENAGVPAATHQLMLIRASQINGCAGCLDMHTKDAAAAGETSVRINLVAGWREAKVFTEAEKAALALTEAGTRIADGTGVSDEVWAAAAKHYDESQLGALVATIAIINSFNRINVMTQQPAGDYEPGMYS
ncbi:MULTISPECIES: carboxymuconolactone decarboxylase family protein [unclassified Streptomyces]|uniref:carboxymuconolactone decarboxylase family protein n=1 Tax=unclassified Streptomyces TaxID=2593676 RepID=UPI000DB9021E|nr:MULTISPECIES: carboxymuconolactone decarboxylase family protein [unclassified Streptomyces]MYT73278.1 carboxymuconolactone decarboxylase family protein [Streptomyces sp. SID8367]RAJ74878.1 AhpD family alkylhydroperoxidase [Streptomyces sp. PsTaAH-137]